MPKPIAQPTTQRSAQRSIIQLGHPTLRQRASQVQDVRSPEIQQLIDELIATVQQANGVGIAAPQVDESYQIMIVASRPNPRYPFAPEMEPTAMINPVILARSEAVEKGWEGCLSVPGVRGWVPRHCEITVEYQDRFGQLQQTSLTGFVARIFQHEYDHFQGLVFLDRVESEADLLDEAAYQAMMNSSDDASKAIEN